MKSTSSLRHCFRSLFLLPFILCLFPSLARSQQSNFADSPYFITSKNWDCGKYRARFANLPRHGLTFLWNTAGESYSCLNGELGNPKVDFIEMILVNETCVSRGDCGPYEILHGYTTSSLKRAVDKSDPAVVKAYTAAAAKACTYVAHALNHDARKVLNPSLETHLSREEFTKVAGWVSAQCPGWEMVWNPVGAKPGLPQAPATLSEGHGSTPHFADNRCIANPDGAVLGSTDWEPYFRHFAGCASVSSWTLNDNCATPTQPRMDPRKRPCKVTVDYKPIRQAATAILSATPTQPPWSAADDASTKGCAVIHGDTDGNGGFVWKESETKKTASGKLAAVTLFPAKYKFKEVTVVNLGKRIDKLTFVYLYKPDKSNRQVWQGSHNPKDYPFNIVLHGKPGDKGDQCWKLTDPHIRND